MLEGGATSHGFTRGCEWGGKLDCSPLAWRDVGWLVAHPYKLRVCNVIVGKANLFAFPSAVMQLIIIYLILIYLQFALV